MLGHRLRRRPSLHDVDGDAGTSLVEAMIAMFVIATVFGGLAGIRERGARAPRQGEAPTHPRLTATAARERPGRFASTWPDGSPSSIGGRRRVQSAPAYHERGM